MTARSSTRSSRKRTVRPFADCTVDRRSRFVSCPLCGANIPWHNINDHLDTVHQSCQPSSDPEHAHPASDQPSLAEQRELDPTILLGDTGSDVQLSKSTAAGTADTSRTFSEPRPVATEGSAPQAWWQQPTVPVPLASARFVGSPRQQTPLTDAELRFLAPCEVVRKALPLKLANSLLKVLLADCTTWVRGTWYMAGKQHSAPRRSAYYTLSSTQEAGPANASSQEALDVSSSVDTRGAPEDLHAATTLISEHVNQLIPSVRNQLAPDDREKWHPSYALCNMYQDGQEGVGAHADRLTMLGPRPVIASLSLGATRTFRLRCMAAQGAHSHIATHQQEHSSAITSGQAQHPACSVSPTSSSESSAQLISQVDGESQQNQQQQDNWLSGTPEASDNGASAQPAPLHLEGVGGATAQHNRAAAAQQSQQAGCVSSVDIVLPHNTLVIMWPPMQEAWKHEIPKCKYVASHPVAGKARINLTFRQLKPAWAERAPCCRCGQRAVMKASLPSSAVQKQQYYYTCDNTKGPGCGFYVNAQVTS